jgi:hypothetical protein
MASITCGNCKQTHPSVEAVRACYQGKLVTAQEVAHEIVMHESHANNPTATKLIQAAAEKRAAKGGRPTFVPSDTLFESPEEEAATHARAERIMGFRKGPLQADEKAHNNSRDRLVGAVGRATDRAAQLANSNRNANNQTKEGFYKVGQSFFKVTPARTSDRTFAHLLISQKGEAPEWEYKGLARVHVPADAPRLTLEDAAEFGKTSGYCMICGRLLTAEESVAAGIGPICAGKL